jgi:hypothetical protein
MPSLLLRRGEPRVRVGEPSLRAHQKRLLTRCSRQRKKGNAQGAGTGEKRHHKKNEMRMTTQPEEILLSLVDDKVPMVLSLTS